MHPKPDDSERKPSVNSGGKSSSLTGKEGEEGVDAKGSDIAGEELSISVYGGRVFIKPL